MTSALRVAFVGKGGAGKSAIAGTFARRLAQNGHRVLAVDSDPMPGLAYSLGLPVSDMPLPDEVVIERGDAQKGYVLPPDISAAQAVERYAALAPDGVRFLQFGKLRGHVSLIGRSMAAWRAIVGAIAHDPEWTLVGDLPGGTRQPFFGWADYAHTVLVVAEPTAKSLLSARRLARLASATNPPEALFAVATKVRQEEDVAMVAERTGLEIVAVIPWDEEFAQAERHGLAPIDAVPDSAAVAAVTQLVQCLAARSGARNTADSVTKGAE